MTNPPQMPPPDADPIVWTLARQVAIDHQPDSTGFCITCQEWSPCGPAESAYCAIALGARCGWLLPELE